MKWRKLNFKLPVHMKNKHPSPPETTPDPTPRCGESQVYSLRKTDPILNGKY